MAGQVMERVVNDGLRQLERFGDTLGRLPDAPGRGARVDVEVNNKWSERHNKRQVLSAYLLPAFGTAPLPDISTAMVDRFKSELRVRGVKSTNGLKPKTVNNILLVLRKCLATAVDWENLDRLPRIRLLKTGPTPFRYLSEHESLALITACEDAHWLAMVLVALDTGLRCSELTALCWEDLDFDRQTVNVVRGKVLGRVDSPKSGKSRIVPLTRRATEALLHLPQGQGSDPVFACGTEYQQARRALRQIAASAGLGRIGWHVLRHTFASRLVAAGAPLKAVQDLLGHSTITMTLRYAHLGPQEHRRAIDLLECGNLGNRRAPEGVPSVPDAGIRSPRTAPIRQVTALLSGGHGWSG